MIGLEWGRSEAHQEAYHKGMSGGDPRHRPENLFPEQGIYTQRSSAAVSWGSHILCFGGSEERIHLSFVIWQPIISAVCSPNMIHRSSLARMLWRNYINVSSRHDVPDRPRRGSSNLLSWFTLSTTGSLSQLVMNKIGQRKCAESVMSPFDMARARRHTLALLDLFWGIQETHSGILCLENQAKWNKPEYTHMVCRGSAVVLEYESI